MKARNVSVGQIAAAVRGANDKVGGVGGGHGSELAGSYSNDATLTVP